MSQRKPTPPQPNALVPHTSLSEHEAQLKDLSEEVFILHQRKAIEFKKFLSLKSSVSAVEKKINAIFEEEKLLLKKSIDLSLSLARQLLKESRLESSEYLFISDFIERYASLQPDKTPASKARPDHRHRHQHQSHTHQPEDDSEAEDYLHTLFSRRLQPTEKETLRKVYYDLAKQFHPDKADSPSQEEYFHLLMQRINDAYKRNDVDELLEIKEDYRRFGRLTPGVTHHLQRVLKTIDILRQKAASLDEEIHYLKSQRRRIEHSEIGKIHRALKKSPEQSAVFFDALREKTKGYREFFNRSAEAFEVFLNTGTFPKDFLEDSIPGSSQLPDPDQLLINREKKTKKKGSKRPSGKRDSSR